MWMCSMSDGNLSEKRRGRRPRLETDAAYRVQLIELWPKYSARAIGKMLDRSDRQVERDIERLRREAAQEPLEDGKPLQGGK